MTIVLGPTWAYEQCDKQVTLGHASVGVGYGTLSHSRLEMCGNDFHVPIPSHSHSHWNTKNFKMSCTEKKQWMIFVRISRQSHSLHNTSSVQDELMTCCGEGLANIKTKWLGYDSSHITEQILIWYCEKLQLEFIPIPTALYLFPYFLIPVI